MSTQIQTEKWKEIKIPEDLCLAPYCSQIRSALFKKEPPSKLEPVGGRVERDREHMGNQALMWIAKLAK